jgi:DNA-binding transcriptional LysR family regulator
MILGMVDVSRLRVFRAVVAAGSIQAAAVNLGYTPSAVSQQVAALARETGLALLQKVGRGIEPTAAGLELASTAGPLFDELAGVEARVADLREGRAGSLTMSYFTSAAMAWIPGIVRRVLAAHPRLRLDLRVRELPTGDDEHVDVEVMVQPGEFVAPSGFRAHHLLDEPYLAILPEGHALAERPFVELGELANERWIAHDSEESWCVINLQRACVSAGFAPAYSVRTSDHLTATAFVAAGIGIAVMPRLCTRTLLPGARAVPVVNPTPVRSIHAMVRRAVEASPPVQLVMGGLFAAADVGLG